MSEIESGENRRRRIRLRKRVEPSPWKRWVRKWWEASSRFVVLALYTLIALIALIYIIAKLMKDSPTAE